MMNQASKRVETNHQVVACITQFKSAWRLLTEAVEQASLRGAVLRIIVCHNLIRSGSKEDFTHFFRKFRHAAYQTCKDHDLRLIIETLDCGSREATEVERMMQEQKTDLLILSDSLPETALARWLPTRTERLKKTNLCPVLLVR
jgi:DNA-binding LacI/PurR family transcriptional regulator